MAKGLRSSTKKANRAKLRVEVFGPIEAARKVRLSAKLLDVASRSMPGIIKDSSMEAFDREPVKQQTKSSKSPRAADILSKEDMELDCISDETSIPRRLSNCSRVRKKKRGKANTSVVFPVRSRGNRAGLRDKPKR